MRTMVNLGLTTAFRLKRKLHNSFSCFHSFSDEYILEDSGTASQEDDSIFSGENLLQSALEAKFGPKISNRHDWQPRVSKDETNILTSNHFVHNRLK